jgi:hypothetical protein
MEPLNSKQHLTMREKIEALRHDYNQLNKIPVFQQPRCIKSVIGDALELIDDMAKRIEQLEIIVDLEVIADQ